MAERFVEGHDESIGKGSFANMPQDVYMKEYPKPRMGRTVEIDDTMSDIDYVQGDSERVRDKYVSHQK